eukprot:scaffold42654_cov30-Prasinocladus_malaysianus.AAC.1
MCQKLSPQKRVRGQTTSVPSKKHPLGLGGVLHILSCFVRGRISRNGRVIKAPRRPGSPEPTAKETAPKEQPASASKEPAGGAKPTLTKRKPVDRRPQEAPKPPAQRRRIIQMPGRPQLICCSVASNILNIWPPFPLSLTIARATTICLKRGRVSGICC